MGFGTGDKCAIFTSELAEAAEVFFLRGPSRVFAVYKNWWPDIRVCPLFLPFPPSAPFCQLFLLSCQKKLHRFKREINIMKLKKKMITQLYPSFPVLFHQISRVGTKNAKNRSHPLSRGAAVVVGGKSHFNWPAIWTKNRMKK
jgi:hypothetical protein